MIKIRFKNTFRERLPEWIASMAMLLWGLIVLSQAPELWDSARFSVLASYATQAVWGWVTVTLGSLRLIALAVNGAWRPTGHIRALGALAGVVVWTAIMIGTTELSWTAPGQATNAAILFIDKCSRASSSHCGCSYWCT